METGEEVKESVFQILIQGIRTGAQRVLKWIVGLMNFMFNVLSKFKIR